MLAEWRWLFDFAQVVPDGALSRTGWPCEEDSLAGEEKGPSPGTDGDEGGSQEPLRAMGCSSRRLRLDQNQPGVVDAHAGQRTRLTCRAEGFPPPTIEWQRDGQTLSSPRCVQLLPLPAGPAQESPRLSRGLPEVELLGRLTRGLPVFPEGDWWAEEQAGWRRRRLREARRQTQSWL